MNSDDLQRSVVQVTMEEGRGTGFVVSSGHVLTCYHVIQDGKRLQVSARGKLFEVLTCMTPPLRNGTPICDLALLEVAELSPWPSVDISDEDPKPGDPLFTFGYTDQYPEGDSALFTFEGPSLEQGENLYRLKGSQARPGLSGSPLLNMRTARVVGVVSRTRDRNSDLGARAVPIALAHDLLRLPRPPTHRGKERPDGGNYVSNERAHVVKLIGIHEGNIRHLEAQIANYGALEVPTHKRNELDSELDELRRLKEALEEF